MEESRKYIESLEEYRRQSATTCFICDLVEGKNPHQLIYEDAATVGFLSKFPSLWGHALVAPKQHRERVTGDFTAKEYLQIQSVVYRVGEAIRSVVDNERLYIMSMGSQQANRHVHWHVAPLPPGVPFENQQFAAFMAEAGYLDPAPEEMASLAESIRKLMS